MCFFGFVFVFRTAKNYQTFVFAFFENLLHKRFEGKVTDFL